MPVSDPRILVVAIVVGGVMGWLARRWPEERPPILVAILFGLTAGIVTWLSLPGERDSDAAVAAVSLTLGCAAGLLAVLLPRRAP